MSAQELYESSYAIIEEAVTDYRPTHVFGLFSGGHDSLCACHIASRHPSFSGCVHINTGIGIEETREFVRDTCKQFGWPLKEYHPPVSYEELVVEQGFPGPAMHWKMYQRLKERCLRQLKREHGGGTRKKLVFISGRRSQESARRMANCKEQIEVRGREVWVNPIMVWGSVDKNAYIEANELPRNEVTEKLCMSGECLCGAFAKPGELDEIRYWYPKAAEEIDRIACKVKEAGKHCVWGTRPPKDGKSGRKRKALPLCTSCEFKYEQSVDGFKI